MSKTNRHLEISTDKAPSAIGPYSQGIRAGNAIYISGQIPLDPVSMEIVTGGFKEQAEQVFKNLEAVAEAAKCSLSNVVKMTVYLIDLDDFADINEVMSDYMSEPYPARAAIQVAALPRGAMIEIDAILHLKA